MEVKKRCMNMNKLGFSGEFKFKFTPVGGDVLDAP